MKNIQIKHTVKLKTKQPDFISYLIKISLGAIPLVCYIMLKKVLTNFNEFGINIHLPNYLRFIIISYSNTCSNHSLISKYNSTTLSNVVKYLRIRLKLL